MSPLSPHQHCSWCFPYLSFFFRQLGPRRVTMRAAPESGAAQLLGSKDTQQFNTFKAQKAQERSTKRCGIYPSTHPSIHLPIYGLSIYQSINLPIKHNITVTFQSIYQSENPINLSICRPINLSISTYQSIYPSIHPFIHSSIYLSICLSIYPFTGILHN